ncbi:MAG: hypothetical protein BGO12_12660 [Verrucomicrobia bacterium 61-8]|nr:hypothetical protein [Verrucomicrobiota bacterium]OJU97588.1 MAG: hypothetical protein BGO12_12660 [Verrucomicrobia bacterium 61-8]
MNNSAAQLSLDPAALTAFVASLSALPTDEIRKAKSLFIRNAIADYQMSRKSLRVMVVMMGVLSIIPIFLIVFIPTFISYRALKENGRQKILNALEVWRSDLGSDYEELIGALDEA